MATLRIGLLNKTRGNFGIQVKFGGKDYARFDTIWSDRGPMFLEANSFAGLMRASPTSRECARLHWTRSTS